MENDASDILLQLIFDTRLLVPADFLSAIFLFFRFGNSMCGL